MIREVDADHILNGDYVVTYVIGDGVFDEAWDKDQALHEVTTAHDYAPRGPSSRQMYRFDVGVVIDSMLTGAASKDIAIGIDTKPKNQPSNSDADIAVRLQQVLQGGFDGTILVARQLPVRGAIEAQNIDPSQVLKTAISSDHVRRARWAIIDQGSRQPSGNDLVRRS